MNLGRYLQKHRAEADKLSKEIDKYSQEMRLSKILGLIENAYGEGALSMVKAKKPSVTLKEASNTLESSKASGFLKDNIGVIMEALLSVITDNSDNGRLTAGWKDVAIDEFAEIVYTIYDLGFLSGITLAQDPKAFSLYVKSREENNGTTTRK